MAGLCACAEPAKIELKGELPVRVTDMTPLVLPAARVLDKSGAEIDAKADVTAEPPGLVELRQGDDGVWTVTPRVRGDVTLRFKAGNASKSVLLALRPVTSLTLRCVPSCRIAKGDSAIVQATAYSGDELLLDLEPALQIDDATIVSADGSKLTALKEGATTLRSEMGEAKGDVVVEVRARADGVKIACPTVYTVSTADDGSKTDVCYLTQGRAATFRAQVQAGGKSSMDERIAFDVLNKSVAEVSPGGQVIPRAIGQTALKAGVVDNPLVFGQIGLYVDAPRAAHRLFAGRFLRLGTAFARLWVYGGEEWVFIAPECKAWPNFHAKAFANVPDAPKPLALHCESAEAIACVAEASLGMSKAGLSSERGLRGWLGPCCCITDADRVALTEKLEKDRKEGRR
jgi:hypothetical protein